jgi:hypothetical protein
MLGTIQTAEALKYTLGSGGLLTEILRTFGGPNKHGFPQDQAQETEKMANMRRKSDNYRVQFPQ